MRPCGKATAKSRPSCARVRSDVRPRDSRRRHPHTLARSTPRSPTDAFHRLNEAVAPTNFQRRRELHARSRCVAFQPRMTRGCFPFHGRERAETSEAQSSKAARAAVQEAVEAARPALRLQPLSKQSVYKSPSALFVKDT